MIKNIGYSFGINFINFLFPLVLTPFYIKVFGISNYGVLAICFALINYIGSINDYSWSTIGPIKISEKKENSSELKKYISLVLNSRILLFILSLIILFLLIQLYPVIKKDSILIISLVIYLFSRSQNIHWIFIGLNKVKIYFIINTIFKVIAILFVLGLLKDIADYKKLFYILGFFDSCIFIVGFIYLYKINVFRYSKSSIIDIKKELNYGSSVFFTNLTICALLNSSTLILGVFFTNIQVGIYNVAEKIIMLCKHTIGVIFQGVFPKICNIGITKAYELKRFLKKMFYSYFIIYFIGGLILVLFSELIISIFTKAYILESSELLVYLAFLPLISALNQPAYISLVLHEKKRTYFYSYTLGLFFNFIFMLIFLPIFGIKGMAFSLLLTELVINLLLNYQVLINPKINFLK